MNPIDAFALIPMAELSSRWAITPNTVSRRLAFLGIKPIRQGNYRFLTPEQVEQAQKLHEHLSSGKQLDMFIKPKILTFNKIMKGKKICDKWGPWRFEDNLVLVNGEDYEIDLEQINSSAKMLDWIFQINGKGREEFCVTSLVQAFRDIFKPQSNCCSFGADKQFSGSKLAKEYRSKLRSKRQKTRSYLKPSLRFKILHRDRYRCQACGASAANGADLHVDHILPVSKGGTNDESNLRTLCSECNIGRGNRYDT